MNKKIFEKIKEIGWLKYFEYEDYLDYLSIHRKLLEEHWEEIENSLLLGDNDFSDDLVHALAFAVDLLVVLEKESE